MNAFEKLHEELYSDTFDLQVTNRRRIVQVVSFNSAAGPTDTGPLTAVATDKLQQGDGILFDYVALNLNPPSTMTINALFFGISISTGFVFIGLTEPHYTQEGTTAGSAMMAFEFTPRPRLWTFNDLGAILGVALTLVNQPIRFTFIGNVNDAGVNAISGHAVVFYRLVRGLQEN